MSLHPGGDGPEIGLCGPGIEDVARGVAVIDCVVDEMGLALKHADAVVELSEDGEVLVGGGVVGEDEGGVVRGDVGDVAVGAGAEGGVAVAGGGVFGCGVGVGSAVIVGGGGVAAKGR